MGVGEAWNLVAIQPMMNMLVMISHYMAGNLGLAIIVLTIIIRSAMFPLTLRQLRATKAMQELQPKLAELQKKHGKDKERLAKEQMKLYKESGVSPAGCMVPMLIQMPIWIALYQSIIRVIAVTPESFLALSEHLYSWQIVYSTLPLMDKFLWLNLAVPDSWFLLPVLVGGSMWVQQKMTTPTTADPQQQAQSRMMLWMMPLMFAFLTMSFPSGLAIYWVASNIVSIVIQYFVTGWGGLVGAKAKEPGIRERRPERGIALPEAPVEGTVAIEQNPSEEVGADYGIYGDKRPDRGGRYPTSIRATKHRSRRSRDRRHKRR